MMSHSVFVVIPAYNENSVLRSTVTGLLSVGYSVVVVDDGSEISATSQLEGLDVHCLRHDINLGQGAALQTGSQFALSRGAQIVVHFDADGQHNPGSIQPLLEPILSGKVDVALGSRFLNACDCGKVPFKRRILLKAGVVVSWLFTGVWLSDTHNGLRALSRRAAQQITLRENGFAHATEILDLLRRSKLPFTEVPVSVQYTEYSQAKGQKALNSVNILIDLMLRRLFS